MSELRYLNEPVQIEERQMEDGTKASYIIGKGIVFDKWSQTMTMQLRDGKTIQFIEKIEPRAVEGVDMTNIVSMVNHKDTIGKRSKGTMDVTVTNEAVNYSVRIPNTTLGSDTRENIANGNLEGSSFQFLLAPKGDIWDKSTTPYQRTITKFAAITEMGPVNYPAYPDTTAAMRSLEESDIEDTQTREAAEKEEFEKRLARLQRKYNYFKIKNNK
jgi:phage head maturation protease